MGNNFSKIIALIVSMSGVIVMIGWIFNIPALTSILPQFVTMKFTTAVCFVLSGIVLYLTAINVQNNNDIAQLMSSFLSFVILLIMASLLVSVFLGIKTGMEDLFVRESPGAVKTVVPGRPALITMVNFLLIASVGLLSLFDKKNLLKVVNIFGLVTAFFGILAIIGYIADMPKLYGHFNNVSTAMALHTAILFVFLGIGFFIIRGNKKSVVV